MEPLLNLTNMTGKTVVITGCTSGIGKATALELAKTGAHIVMACRDSSRAEVVKQEIVTETHNTNVICKSLDLSSLQSVRQFAEECNKSLERIDVLINNAGVFKTNRTLSADGYELTFATNHLGHFLLTHLLVEKLKSSAPSRVVIVSSKMHEKYALDFEDIECEHNYKGEVAYSRSKTANLLFATKLAGELKDSGVTIYSLHPGVVITELQRDFPILKNCLMQKIFGLLMCCCACQRVITPYQAARTVLYCSCDDSITSQTGLYYQNCKVYEAKPHATDEEDAKRLWDLSLKMCGI